MRRLAFLAAAFLAAAVPSRAAVFCVKPAPSGACQSTIQAAVTLAGPNDVINILPGIYRESVVVPAGKDGLSLVGASKLATIMDLGPDSATAYAGGVNALSISSNGVKVRNFTIRHVQAGFAVGTLGSNVVVSGMRFVGNAGYNGFFIGGTGSQFVGNEVSAAAQVGVASGQANFVVKANRFMDVQASAVFVVADGAQVVGNVITHVTYDPTDATLDTDGIHVEGDGATISSNTILGSAAYGIYVEGDTATAAYNRVSDVEDDGIYVEGSGAYLHHNVVANAGANGVSALLPAYAVAPPNVVSFNTVTNVVAVGVAASGGSGATASSNRVTSAGVVGVVSVAHDGTTGTKTVASGNVVSGGGTVTPGAAMQVLGSPVTVMSNVLRDFRGLAAFYGGCNGTNCSGSVIQSNQVSGTASDTAGIYVKNDGPGALVKANLVNKAGFWGLVIEGPGAATVTLNRVFDAGSHNVEACIVVLASGSTVTNNVTGRCAQYGFAIAADNTTVTANVTSSNFGNGFAVSGNNNVLTSNRSTSNAGDGFAVQSGTGNALPSGNVSALNRHDFCDEGTGTTVQAFTSVAPACDIERN